MRSLIRRIARAGGAERPTPLIVFGLLLFATLSVRCASRSDSDDGGSRASGGSGAAAGAMAGQGGSLAPMGGTSSVPSGGSGQAPTCSPENVELDCALPPSTCQDAFTLRYFTDATCVSGQCSWSSQTMPCMGGCVGGACIPSSTTAAPLPPDPACVGSMSGASGGGGSPGARTAAGFGGIAGDGGSEDGGGDAGAGATSGCPLPASYCQDDRTLVYFTDPHCVGSWCSSTPNTIDCGGPCENGGCRGPGTAASPP